MFLEFFLYYFIVGKIIKILFILDLGMKNNIYMSKWENIIIDRKYICFIK